VSASTEARPEEFAIESGRSGSDPTTEPGIALVDAQGNVLGRFKAAEIVGYSVDGEGS
jgi:hypothetical protein